MPLLLRLTRLTLPLLMPMLQLHHMLLLSLLLLQQLLLLLLLMMMMLMQLLIPNNMLLLLSVLNPLYHSSPRAPPHFTTLHPLLHSILLHSKVFSYTLIHTISTHTALFRSSPLRDNFLHHTLLHCTSPTLPPRREMLGFLSSCVLQVRLLCAHCTENHFLCARLRSHHRRPSRYHTLLPRR